MVEVHHRALVSRAPWRWCAHAGASFDPGIADVLHRRRRPILAGPSVGDTWDVALREAPDRGENLDDVALDDLLEAPGDPST